MRLGDRVEVISCECPDLDCVGRRGIIYDFTGDGHLVVDLDDGSLQIYRPLELELVVNGRLLYECES